MSILIHFLLVFNGASGELVSPETFEEEDLATSAFSVSERSQEGDEQIEVALISANSFDALQDTHRHFFSSREIDSHYNKLLIV